MSDILSENQADKQVIISLLKHIKILERRNQVIHKILFDENGDLYRVHDFEKITQADLELELADAKIRVGEVEGAISFSNKLQQDEQPAIEEPTPEPVQETPVAAEPIVEAPVVNIPLDEVTPEVAQEEAPATTIDPATAPAPAPIVLN